MTFGFLCFLLLVAGKDATNPGNKFFILTHSIYFVPEIASMSILVDSALAIIYPRLFTLASFGLLYKSSL